MPDLTTTIKNRFSQINKREVSYDKPSISPLKDWMIVIISTQILVFLCGAFAIYFYIKVDRGQIFGGADLGTQSEIKINSQLLEKTIETLNKKETLFNEAKSGSSIPRDPSI